jgi:hypothetical protein
MYKRKLAHKTRVEGEDVIVSEQKLVVLEDVEMEGGWKLDGGGVLV